MLLPARFAPLANMCALRRDARLTRQPCLAAASPDAHADAAPRDIRRATRLASRHSARRVGTATHRRQRARADPRPARAGLGRRGVPRMVPQQQRPGRSLCADVLSPAQPRPGRPARGRRLRRAPQVSLEKARARGPSGRGRTERRGTLSRHADGVRGPRRSDPARRVRAVRLGRAGCRAERAGSARARSSAARSARARSRISSTASSDRCSSTRLCWAS